MEEHHVEESLGCFVDNLDIPSASVHLTTLLEVEGVLRTSPSLEENEFLSQAERGYEGYIQLRIERTQHEIINEEYPAEKLCHRQVVQMDSAGHSLQRVKLRNKKAAIRRNLYQ